MMPKKVIDVHFKWKEQDFPHLECCSGLLNLDNLEGKNNHTFSAVEFLLLS